MRRSPVDELADPFVQIVCEGESGAAADLPAITPVVGIASDGVIPPATLETLREQDPDFPARLTLRPDASNPVGRLHDSHGDPVSIAVMTPDDVPAALKRGAILGEKLDPGEAVSIQLTTELSPQSALAFVEGLLLGADRMKQEADDATVTANVLLPEGLTATEVADRVARVRGVILARALANTPSNTKSPAWLAEQAQALAGDGVEVQVLTMQDLRENGFGGVLGVGQGSDRSANVTILRWQGSADADAPQPRVIVGKGITFDSGGLSIKPAAGMPMMKTDMSGAAAVLGTFAAIKQLKPADPVVGVIACAENMPSGSAMRPGDVIKHVGGRTTEVLNTDAEGRLVLADALVYATEVFDPRAIVDIATLTGSATVGLGRHHAACYSTSPDLMAELQAASDSTRDDIWPMPLVPEYETAIASDVADAANTNTDSHTSAGSITAALFLKPFAAEVPWAHLDIAGTGRRDAASPGQPKGATGYGVQLLTQWLMAESA